MAATNPVPTGPPTALVAAIKRLLRPLIRLMLSYQVTYPMLLPLLKEVYVDVAEQEFPVAGREQTDSRISLLTGVHRKDVRRLRSEQHAGNEPPKHVSMAAEVIGRWTGVPEYLDSLGRPRALPRFARAGAIVSFEDLVQSVSKDIRPRVMYDEWLRLGVISLDEDGRVMLNISALVPQKGFDEKAYYFGQNLHDHVAAGAHNILGRTPSFFDRSVFSDGLDIAAAAELSQLANDYGMQSLLAMNRRAVELEEQVSRVSTPTHRINFGVYFFSEPVEATRSSDEHD